MKEEISSDMQQEIHKLKSERAAPQASRVSELMEAWTEVLGKKRGGGSPKGGKSISKGPGSQQQQ